MAESIKSIDLHGCNAYQARVAIDAALRKKGGVHRLRLIHGHNRGTVLRDMIWEEYASRPGVIRLIKIDDATTDIVLREF